MTKRVEWLEMVSDVAASKISDSPQLNSAGAVPNKEEITQNSPEKHEKVEISSGLYEKSTEQATKVETPIKSPVGKLIQNVDENTILNPTGNLRKTPANIQINQSFEQSTRLQNEGLPLKHLEVSTGNPLRSPTRQDTVQPIEIHTKWATRQLIIQPDGKISTQPLHSNIYSILNNGSHPNPQHQRHSNIHSILNSNSHPKLQHQIHSVSRPTDNRIKPENITLEGRLQLEAGTTNEVLWNTQSDLLLRYLKEVRRFTWSKISEYFASRTTPNIRSRWKVLKNGSLKDCYAMTTDIHSIDIATVLKKLGINKKLSNECIPKRRLTVQTQNEVTAETIPWDLQSDLLLRYLKDVRGFGWKNISEYFINRTANGCKTRWKAIKYGAEKDYHAVPIEIYSIDVAAILKNMGVEKKLPELNDKLKVTDKTTTATANTANTATANTATATDTTATDMATATTATANINNPKDRNARLQSAESSIEKAVDVKRSDQASEIVDESNKQEHLKVEEPIQSKAPVATPLPSNLIKSRGKPARSPTKGIISKNTVTKNSSAKVSTSSKKRILGELINDTPKKRKTSKYEEAEDEVYGILEKPNIKQVQFGLSKLFPTWYGSAVYFEKTREKLGIYSSKDRHSTSSDYNNVDRSPSKHNTTDKMMDIESDDTRNNGKENNEDGRSSDDDTNEKDDGSIWLDTLYVCEYCFKYTTDPDELKIHDSLCKYKLNKPPGKIKYRSPEYTIRRVKGYKEKLFCQCLCLFTKLFLDNKSIYFKVENYDFFILYETGGHKPMAFFSRDITSFNQNNLACILTLPPYQRKGLGSLLIEFSYKLSRSEGLISGPELPLSPFGLIGYINHWGKAICFHILDGDLSHLLSVTIKDISLVTGFRIDDIIMTLNYLECLDQETGTINTNQLFVWLRSRKKKNEGFMLKDEYLMISD